MRTMESESNLYEFVRSVESSELAVLEDHSPRGTFDRDSRKLVLEGVKSMFSKRFGDEFAAKTQDQEILAFLQEQYRLAWDVRINWLPMARLDEIVARMNTVSGAVAERDFFVELIIYRIKPAYELEILQATIDSIYDSSAGMPATSEQVTEMMAQLEAACAILMDETKASELFAFAYKKYCDVLQADIIELGK
jgi:hypothetical protein